MKERRRSTPIQMAMSAGRNQEKADAAFMSVVIAYFRIFWTAFSMDPPFKRCQTVVFAEQVEVSDIAELIEDLITGHHPGMIRNSLFVTTSSRLRLDSCSPV